MWLFGLPGQNDAALSVHAIMSVVVLLTTAHVAHVSNVLQTVAA